MNHDVQVMHWQAPNVFVKNLTNANESEAAICVARELLRLPGDNGKIESHYSRHMHEHHLPILMPALVTTCGKEAL
jgi:hypothetical protein